MHLNARQAAQLLRVSDKTVYRWAKQGSLPTHRLHDQIRFNRAELMEWALTNRINISGDFSGEESDEDAGFSGLGDGLRAGGIHYRVGGSTVAEVLTSVARLMTALDDSDRDLLLRFLIARESLGSTGVGDGISIPHPRSPIVTYVDRPTVSLCFLDNPVDFKALDGKPVHTLFLLLSPTIKAHLRMLSRVVFALRVPRLLNTIRERAGRAEILEAAFDIDRTLAAVGSRGTVTA